jgi:hypothetical protein
MQVNGMLTLQETLASQSDLESLCAERPLRTREAFAPNAYYGIGQILKQYAGLPHTFSLKAIIPHGIVFDESFVWKAEVRAPVPVVFCWPPYREQAYATLAGKKVILSAAPFLYVVEMLKNQPQPFRQGTIFFPHHSTHHISAEMDFERLAEELAHFAAEYQPVTVCIYWRDYNLGHHLPFERKGLRIVSAGHMFDPDFLFRFYHLCSAHRYASANGLGSNMFYSVKAGCSYFYFDGVVPRPVADKHVRERDVSKTPPSTELTLKALFSSRQPFATAEQLSETDYYLGADYLKSPADLRKQLVQAEVLDKTGFVSRTGAGDARFAAPAFLRRSVRRLGRKLLTTGRRLSEAQTSDAQNP